MNSSLNLHKKQSNKARCLVFGGDLHQVPLIVLVTIEGSSLAALISPVWLEPSLVTNV